VSKKGWTILVIGILAGMMAAAYWFFGDSPDQGKPASPVPEAETEPGPVAQVEVTKIKQGPITQNITTYGLVIPSRKAIQTISVSFESQVRRLRVINGQKISRGDILLEIDSSPDAHLLLEQARNDYESSRRNLQNVRQRFDLKIATEQQLLRAQQAMQQARLRMESLEKRGIGRPQVLRAGVEGLVNKVFVRERAIVPAGSPMVEIVAQNKLEVRLGVEPEDIPQVYVGLPVSLTRVNVPAFPGVVGHIREISQTVNPATRLVDVFVTFPSSARLLPGEWILGRIAATSSLGLLVPRSAVLPERKGYVLFTVSGGAARKHFVQIGLENEKEFQVIGQDLNPGDWVVVLGNYELRDGMKVKVGASP
jgi:membrane fusion protein (multidrug efflux system)